MNHTSTLWFGIVVAAVGLLYGDLTGVLVGGFFCVLACFGASDQAEV